MQGNSPKERWWATVEPTLTPPPVAVAYELRDPTPIPGASLSLPPLPPLPSGYGIAPPASMLPPPPRDARKAPPARPSLSKLIVRTITIFAATAMFAFLLSRALVDMPRVATAAWRAMGPVTRALLLAERSSSAGSTVLIAPQVFTRWSGATSLPGVRHDGYASIRGGVLFTPDTFEPTDSSYDLIVHFHGNTQLVRESAEAAGLNAAVAVINLGIGSGPYEDTYAQPGAFEALVGDIERALVQRGLPNPRLRRLALSSWSAGYGAVAKILELRRGIEALDAILVTDGIHCGFLPERPIQQVGGPAFDAPESLNPLQLASFVRAAQLAGSGKILFTITHSEIDPVTYASSSATANYLLAAVAGHPVDRTMERSVPPHLRLKAAEGAVSRKLEKQMVPTGEARIGALHVRGFRGNTPEHHMAHLLQSAATVFPELAERWGSSGRSPTPTP